MDVGRRGRIICEAERSSIVGGLIGAVRKRSPNSRAPGSELNGDLPRRPDELPTDIVLNIPPPLYPDRIVPD
jgi:hypothetical protein